ncbi:MAG: hypothetical protein HRT44_07580, partial [Bdellovibrionales bacterium]|nr:hypothetical protein [Bdellovibrionales bacterium]NQZ19098.1 hypothetical protein [Bdellovibrionales bacterium]
NFPELQTKVVGFISYRGTIKGDPRADQAPKPLSHYQLQKAQAVPLSLAISRLWIWLKSYTQDVSEVLYSLSTSQRKKYLEKKREKINRINSKILFVGFEDEPWSILKSHPYLMLSKTNQDSVHPKDVLIHFNEFYKIDQKTSSQISFSKN